MFPGSSITTFLGAVKGARSQRPQRTYTQTHTPKPITGFNLFSQAPLASDFVLFKKEIWTVICPHYVSSVFKGVTEFGLNQIFGEVMVNLEMC